MQRSGAAALFPFEDLSFFVVMVNMFFNVIEKLDYDSRKIRKIIARILENRLLVRAFELWVHVRLVFILFTN